MDFLDTRAGMRFVEKTVPDLTRAVVRLAEAVEKLNERENKKD